MHRPPLDTLQAHQLVAGKHLGLELILLVECNVSQNTVVAFIANNLQNCFLGRAASDLYFGKWNGQSDLAINKFYGLVLSSATVLTWCTSFWPASLHTLVFSPHCSLSSLPWWTMPCQWDWVLSAVAHLPSGSYCPWKEINIMSYLCSNSRHYK